MHCSGNGVYDRHGGLLVPPELPHHALWVVLLHVDVEHHWLLRQPVLLVLEAECREALRCAGGDGVDCVQRPNDLAVYQGVDLPAEVDVRPPGLLGVVELHNTPEVSW